MVGTLFSYSGPASYQSFLADIPNVDGVDLLVNLHMAKSLATQTDLSRRGIQVMETAALQASADMAVLHAETSQVQRRIEDLSGIVQNGFNAVSLELNGIGQSLSELVHIAKTPDQTWAFEQYSIASDAYESGHIEEAMDYVNRAISGHGERPGFRLEHRFHALRGLIHLGGPGNTDPAIVDPEKSISDFELALKYAGQTDGALLARYRNLLGWAYYCLGRFDEARRELEAAVEIDQDNARAYYDLAKVLVRSGQIENGLLRLENSFRTDWLFGIRATGDADFADHLPDVAGRIELFRANIVARLQCFISKYDNLSYRHLQKMAEDTGFVMPDHPAEFFENLGERIASASVANLLSECSEASDRLDEAIRHVKIGRKELLAKRDAASFSLGGEAPFLIASLSSIICGMAVFVWTLVNSNLFFSLVAAIAACAGGYFLSYLTIVPLVCTVISAIGKAGSANLRGKYSKVLKEFDLIESE